MAAASHGPRGLQPTEKLLKAVALKKNNKSASRRVLLFWSAKPGQNSRPARAGQAAA
jgi:hypothetical protein